MPQISSESILANEIAQYYADPLGFVLFAYPWGKEGTSLARYPGPDTWQRDFLTELGDEIKKRGFNGFDPVKPILMTRSSGHGIGKGVLSSFLLDFILSTRPSCKGSVTANSFTQLDTKTWATMRHWTKMCITAHWFEITATKMWKKGKVEDWFAALQSPAEENVDSFAGQHAANSTSFYIFDEASNVSDKIFDKADGGMTDGEPMMFVFGNPTRSSGKFWNINFGPDRNGWNHKAIDSRSCRYTQKETIAEWEKEWGKDSDRFRVQVLGLPPAASDLQFISTDLVSKAKARQLIHLVNDPLICGLDISRGGKDDCVFRFRRGRDAKSINCIRVSGEDARDSTVIEYKALDILKNGVLVIKDDGTFYRERVDMMFIDGTGVGGPICDRLKALQYEDRVTEIQFGWEAPNMDGYQSCANMRSWMWEVMRVWLKTGMVDDSSDLESDLTGPMYHYRTSDNALVLESKESMKKRRGTAIHGGSPDDGDALALTFARPVAPRKSQRQIERESAEEYDWEVHNMQGRVWG